MALAAGDKLGPYEILAPIGKGGMGEVYRARDTRLHREVAIKVLPQAFATDPRGNASSARHGPRPRSIIPISALFTTWARRRGIRSW